LKSVSTVQIAMITVAISGLAWGVFWMPLRALDAAGITGIWAVVLFNMTPALLLLPVLVFRFRQMVAAGWSLQISGMIAGTALVLYSGALIFTEVVNALFLFYLTPFWSTLLSRLVMKEPITKIRWLTMIVALIGLIVILRLDQGLNITFNAGDWIGLASGIVWAVAAVRINANEESRPLEYTVTFFFWGTIVALILTWLPLERTSIAPEWSAIQPTLWWLIPVAIFLIIPPAYAVMWGASLISPGLLGILFMTEIGAGAVSAAIFAGEPFGAREAIGIILIAIAGLLEPVSDIFRNRRAD